MALVFMSGFEWNTLREFETQGGVLQSSPKRSGNYSVTFGTYNVLEKTLSQALTEAYVQFAFYPKQANPWCFFSLRKNGADLVSIRKNASGCLEVCQGWDGSVYCTGSTILQINTWYVIELHFKLDDVNGLIEVRLDGISECSFSGDTKPGADADFNQMRWRAPSSYNDFNVDDIVVFDTSGEVNNSWPNGLKLVLLKPNADGGVNEWAPTPAGDHYACVDEVPPAETDYLYQVAI